MKEEQPEHYAPVEEPSENNGFQYIPAGNSKGDQFKIPHIDMTKSKQARLEGAAMIKAGNGNRSQYLRAKQVLGGVSMNNNRKQTNSRGVIPRPMVVQTIVERQTKLKDGKVILNPKFGQVKKVYHRLVK